MKKELSGRFVVSVEVDEDPLDPRQNNYEIGQMLCLHSRYSLGDPHEFTLEEVQDLAIHAENTGGIVIPLYLYDHGGITMNTTGFSCPWDSGQVGVYIMSKADIDSEFGGNRTTARTYIDGAVQRYDDFLTGNVYGFIVTDPNGNDLDSCWGFSGDPEIAMNAGIESANYFIKEAYTQEMALLDQ